MTLGVSSLWLLGGCHVERGERVLVRLADELYGERRIAGVGTSAYPRVEVGGETRMVCSPASRDTLAGTLFARDVSIPAGASIDFAYALDAGEAFSGIVDVSAAVTTAHGTDVIFTATLDGAANDYGRWHEAVVQVSDPVTHVEFFAATPALSTAPGLAGEKERPPSLHLACPVVTVATPEPPPRNVVLVSLDTLRADRLGLYGYGRRTSPNIDRIFGRDGLVFERAVAPASNTLRSHAGMLTGLQPILAVANWRDPKLGRLGSYPTLADRLGARGYRTAAFTEDGFVSDVTFGFGKGFEVFDERKGVAGNVHNAGTIEETFRRGLAWATAHVDEPFFLFLHSYEVHSPYRPKREYRDRFASAPGSDQARIDSDLYDAEVAQADDAIRDLVDGLDRLGVLERTLLIVTSDHGEEFGEHGGRYHGAHMYGEVLHVPLLMLGRGLLAPGRSSSLVSLVDVVPTVLELLGAEVPRLTGRSRAGEILGTQSSAQPIADRGTDGASARARESERADQRAVASDAGAAEALFSEGVAAESMTYHGLDPDWRSPSLAVTSWPYRLIRYSADEGARYELYDLTKDTREKKDIFAAESERREIVALREALDTYEQTWADEARELSTELDVAQQPGAPPVPSNDAGGPGVSTPPNAPAAVPSAPGAAGTPNVGTPNVPANPTREQLEELRALGYVD